MRIIMVVFITFIFQVNAAYACSCSNLSQEELYDRADAVYLAEVTDTKLIKEKTDRIEKEWIEAKITILEIFKGPKSPITTVHDLSFGFGNCSIGLMSGMEFILFIDAADEGSDKNYVGMCNGSQSINLGFTGLEDILNKIRELSK